MPLMCYTSPGALHSSKAVDSHSILSRQR